jgi:hypothetical protein
MGSVSGPEVSWAIRPIEVFCQQINLSAGHVYAALAMPFAVLVGQIAHAYGR